jgi:hypothetical protein
LYRGDLHGEIEVEIEDGHDGFGGSEYLLDEDYEVNYCILFLFYKITMNVMQSIGGAMITGPTSSSSSSLIVSPIPYTLHHPVLLVLMLYNHHYHYFCLLII